MRVENLVIEPDQRARVVINERTGMVIAGGDVRVSQVTISHGELKISVTNDYAVTQPRAPILATGVAGLATGARASVVPLTNLDVDESESRSVSLNSSTTVADLVRALAAIHTSPREMISILQGIKAAGALYAELIIQ